MKAKVTALPSRNEDGLFEAASAKLHEAIERTDATPSQGDLIHGNSDVLTNQWRQQYEGEDIGPLTLAIRLRRVAMLIDEVSTQACEKADIKLNDMLLLMALRRVGPPHSLRPTDILKMHSVTSGTVTYRIDQITKQNLAERIADPKDRRGYLIQLTPHGLATIDEVLRKQLHVFRESLRPMTDIPGALPLLQDALRLYERCISLADRVSDVNKTDGPEAPAPRRSPGLSRRVSG